MLSVIPGCIQGLRTREGVPLCFHADLEGLFPLDQDGYNDNCMKNFSFLPSTVSCAEQSIHLVLIVALGAVWCFLVLWSRRQKQKVSSFA